MAEATVCGAAEVPSGSSTQGDESAHAVGSPAEPAVNPRPVTAPACCRPCWVSYSRQIRHQTRWKLKGGVVRAKCACAALRRTNPTYRLAAICPGTTHISASGKPLHNTHLVGLVPRADMQLLLVGVGLSQTQLARPRRERRGTCWFGRH